MCSTRATAAHNAKYTLLMQTTKRSIMSLEPRRYQSFWRRTAEPLAMARPSTASRMLGGGGVVRGRDGGGSGSHFPIYFSAMAQLSKARLSLLVVSTAASAFVMGSGESVDARGLALTSAGTFACAAAANALNQLWEVKNDSLMMRTKHRPLPSGRVSAIFAGSFAVVCSGLGCWMLYETPGGSLAAALGAGNIVLYTLVYTPMKVIHPLNTWVGAAVGAVPPLIGWAASTGSLDLGSLPLAAILWCWQIPHFMALAWMCREDYMRGGYRMLSHSDLDPRGVRVAAAGLRNCLYLIPLGFTASWANITSPLFAAESIAVNSMMIGSAWQFYRCAQDGRYTSAVVDATAKRLFRGTLLYLPVLMAFMMFHRIPQDDRGRTNADARGYATGGHVQPHLVLHPHDTAPPLV